MKTNMRRLVLGSVASRPLQSPASSRLLGCSLEREQLALAQEQRLGIPVNDAVLLIAQTAENIQPSQIPELLVLHVSFPFGRARAPLP